MNVFASLIGTILVMISLDRLIPNGNWAYLIGLVFGVQLIIMAIRDVLRRK